MINEYNIKVYGNMPGYSNFVSVEFKVTVFDICDSVSIS
jgi:hypothetical protein